MKLTTKQRAFLKELRETFNPTEAAWRVYDCKTRASAGQIAYENLKKLEVPYKELMEKMGLTDEQDVADLKRLRNAKRVQSCDVYISRDGDKYKVNENSNDFIEVDDGHIQLKALELTYRLKGQLKSGELQSQINIQVTNLIPRPAKEEVGDPNLRNL